MKKTKRQPNKPKENRTCIVQFRLTAASYEKLKKEAEAVGILPNECARLKTTNSVLSVRQVQELPVVITYELNRIGSNVNQIARTLHTTGEYEPAALEEACQHLDEVLRAILASIT